MNYYDEIYEELCYRVECGELSLEDAELINEAAYDRYVLEFKKDIDYLYTVVQPAQARANSKHDRYTMLTKKDIKDSESYDHGKVNQKIYDHGSHRWTDKLEPQRLSRMHADQIADTNKWGKNTYHLYRDNPNRENTRKNKEAWDRSIDRDMRRSRSWR